PNPRVSAGLQKIGDAISLRGSIFAAWRAGFPVIGRRTGLFLARRADQSRELTKKRDMWARQCPR
ncbi:MAG: hypothetical protein WEB57_14920, partial [Pseudohongiellaceae bacterium]